MSQIYVYLSVAELRREAQSHVSGVLCHFFIFRQLVGNGNDP